METVEFVFDLDEKVETPFGFGLVDMLGVDDGGIKYHIKTKDGGDWFKQSQLKKIGCDHG